MEVKGSAYLIVATTMVRLGWCGERRRLEGRGTVPRIAIYFVWRCRNGDENSGSVVATKEVVMRRWSYGLRARELACYPNEGSK